MQEIRAAVIEAAGTSRRHRDPAPRRPGPGEVLVRMAASGVCHSDLHVRDGHWERPGADRPRARGRRVHRGGGPGHRPVGRRAGSRRCRGTPRACVCRECQRGRQWLCLGSPSLHHRQADGTHAAGARRRVAGARLPVDRDVRDGAGRAGDARWSRCPTASRPTSRRSSAAASRRASAPWSRRPRCRPDRPSPSIGLGGVGLSCVMGAVLAGARRIVAVDVNPAKLELAGELGATHWVQADPADPAARGGGHPPGRGRRRSGLRVRGDRAAGDDRAGGGGAAARAGPRCWWA